jgi:hypothetical protein
VRVEVPKKVIFFILVRICRRPRFSVFRVYDDAGNVIETHEHKGDFKLVVTQKMFATTGSVSQPEANVA